MASVMRQAVPAGVTAQIAKYVAAATYDELAQRVVAAAKDSFLDTLGIAIAGAAEPGGRLVSQYVTRAGGVAESTVIGAGVKVPARAAAEANGTLAHIVGFSDFSVPNVLHPSVAVHPAVWAVGEAVRASGRQLLLAHVVGVEVSCKIARVLTTEFTQRGFHPCAIVGTFGAAAAAAKLLGLDAAGIANALGIAGQRAAGIKVSLGTLKDGTRLQASADRNLGDDAVAASPEKRSQLVAKFMSCTMRALSRAEAERVIALVDVLDEETDIGRLMALVGRTTLSTPEDGSASSKQSG